MSIQSLLYGFLDGVEGTSNRDKLSTYLFNNYGVTGSPREQLDQALDIELGITSLLKSTEQKLCLYLASLGYTGSCRKKLYDFLADGQLAPLIACGMFAYYNSTHPPVDNIWPEQTGDFPSDAQVRNYVLLGDGSVKATFGTGSEAITYFDMDTGLEVNTNLTLGEYTFLLGVKYDWVEIDATGEVYNMQETDGDFLLSNRGNTAQLENAPEPSALWVADDIGVSTFNGVGGRVSDGVSYYYEPEALNLIPINANIPAITTLQTKTIKGAPTLVEVPTGDCNAYNSAGELVKAEYVGEIMRDIGVVNGVVDNGHDAEWNEDYSEWADFTSNVSIDDNKICFDNWIATEQALNYSVSLIKENTQYTMAYRISDSDLTTAGIRLSSTGINLISETLETANGEYSVTFMTDVTFTSDFIRLIGVSGDGTQSFCFEVLKIYETALGDNSDGGMTIENSHVQKVIDRTMANNDPNEIYTDQTDESNLGQKLVANSSIITGVAGQTGYIYNNQYFYKIEDGVISDMALFDEPLDEQSDCIEKAMKYLGMLDPLYLIDGSPWLDENGKQMYALNEGVVIE